MKAIIYGPQGCGKTRNAKELAQYLGFAHIIDDGEYEDEERWFPGAPIPEDTLVLTSHPVDVALDFFKVMEAMSLNQKLGTRLSLMPGNTGDIEDVQEKRRLDPVLDNLMRDIESLMPDLCRSRDFFSVSDVFGYIKIFNLQNRKDLRSKVCYALQLLGCEQQERLYDLSEHWFSPPKDLAVSTDVFVDLLEPFTSLRKSEFSLDVAAEFLQIIPSHLTCDARTRIGAALKKLGCTRVEKRNDKVRFWYQPPSFDSQRDKSDSNRT